jgi:hypothetical protein
MTEGYIRTFDAQHARLLNNGSSYCDRLLIDEKYDAAEVEAKRFQIENQPSYLSQGTRNGSSSQPLSAPQTAAPVTSQNQQPYPPQLLDLFVLMTQALQQNPGLQPMFETLFTAALAAPVQATALQ